jgi:hypothetical protein
MLINIPISTNIASTRPTKHTKDMDKAENKTLAHIKKTVQRTHTTEKDTRKAKKIKDFDKRNTMFITNQAASQQSTLLRNAREHIKGFVNKLYTQQSKILSLNSTTAFLFSIKDLKELIILLLLSNLIQSSLC